MYGSLARRSSAGSTPTVESVTRRGETAEAVLVSQDPQRLHRRVVVVQRLTHAHEDDVEALVEHAELAQQDADLAGDLAHGEVADDAHAASEAEGALHRAADLGGDAEGLRRGVGDEDRFDEMAVGELEEELGRAVDGTFLLGDGRRAYHHVAREPRAQLTPEVGHRLEVGHAAAINPPEDLTPMEAGHARRGEMLFDLVELELSRVDANGGGHGAVPAARSILHSTMRIPKRSGAFLP